MIPSPVLRRLFPLVMIFSFFVEPILAESWEFSAQEVLSTQTEDNPSTILKGNIVVKSENREIKATHLEFKGKDYDFIQGEQNVSLLDLEKETTISAQKFIYNRKDKIFHFRGQVTVEDRKEDIVIRCESLDFYETDELMIMQVAVRLIKENIISRGEFATYQNKNQILEISGKPIVWRDGDKYQADRIQINLETDEIVMEGNVTGALVSPDQ